MTEYNPTGAYNVSDSQSDSTSGLFSRPAGAAFGAPDQIQDSDAESTVLYRQISYEELEECVFIVRDSISEFYLAPQGEISFAVVEAAVEAALKNKTASKPMAYKYVSSAQVAQPADEAVRRQYGEPAGDANAAFFAAAAGAARAAVAAGTNNAAGVAVGAVGAAGAAAEATNASGAAQPEAGAAPAETGEWTAGSVDAIPGATASAVSMEVAASVAAANTDAAVAAAAPPTVEAGAAGIARTARGHIAADESVFGNDIYGDGPAAQKNRATSRKTYQAHTIPIHQIYRESIKKRIKKRRASTLKYLASSFCGALLGGLLIFIAITIILPMFGYYLNSSQPDKVQEVVHTLTYGISGTQIEDIYDKVSPSIVGIRASGVYNDYVFGQQQGAGDGSGIIIHSDGYILTNNHVISAALPAYAAAPGGGGIQDAQAESYLQVVIQRDPDTVYNARLVARDIKTDVAVLKIDAVNLPVAELGDSDQLKHGEMVIAIGRPANMGNLCSITDGIVSGFNRNANNDADMELSLIQTSAAINAGNSGGALVNSKGEVVGINVITTDSSGYIGMSFAIPINTARLAAENLIDFNYVRGRAKTGIGYSEAFNDYYEFYQRQYPNIPKGVYVDYVEPLSGAFTAGIRVGDVITKMRGEAISDYIEMLELKDKLIPGEVIDIEVFRAGEYINMHLEVSEETGEGPEYE